VVLLVLKILVPLLSVILIVRRERRERPDMGIGELTKRTAGRVTMALLAAVVLVGEHMTQSASVAAAQAEAAGARQARQRIEASTLEQTEALATAQEKAEKARRALQRIEDATAEVVALMRATDPSLTAQEALDRLADELRELHKRSAGLEAQLSGLQMYSDVAALNVLGDPDTAGVGLRYSSALTRARRVLGRA